MRNIIFILIVFAALASCKNETTDEAQTNTGDQTSIDLTKAKVIVYYFHGDRRCPSCIAISDETNKFLTSGFKADMEAGIIVYKDVNIDKEENKAIAEKYQIAGSALLIIKNDKGTDVEITDLTGDGFKFAMNKPEIFVEKLKNAIDKYLIYKK